MVHCDGLENCLPNTQKIVEFEVRLDCVESNFGAFMLRMYRADQVLWCVVSG
jgi:hypothetical protein